MRAYPHDRRSYLWLFLGFIGLNLTFGLHAVPIGGWIAWPLLVRFTRTQPFLRAYALLGVAKICTTGVDAWEGSVPFTGVLLGGVLLIEFLTFGLPYVLDKWVSRRIGGFASTVVFPLTVTSLEFLTLDAGPAGSFGSMAYSQYGYLPTMQIASITGIWGLTFLVGWSAGVVNWVWESDFSWRSIRVGVITFAGVLLVVELYGGLRLAMTADNPAPTVYSAAFTAVDSRQAWAPFTPGSAELLALIERGEGSDSFREKSRSFHELYFDGTARLAVEGAKIILWPEASAIVWTQDEADLLDRARMTARREEIYLALPILVIYGRSDQPISNKLLIVDPQGEIVLEHVKFGGNVFEGSVKGEGTLRTAETPFGTLSGAICWDLDFPSVMRQSGQARTDILLAPSGDWRQIYPFHAQMAVFRAIENGFSLVRQADNGLSIATDPYGRVLAAVDHFAGGDRVMRAQVPIRGVRTIYSYVGDSFAWLSVLGCIGMYALAFARRNR